MLKGKVPEYRGKCSGCGGERDTTGRYCKRCRREYRKEWAKLRTAEFQALRDAVKKNGGQSGEDGEQEKTPEG